MRSASAVLYPLFLPYFPPADDTNVPDPYAGGGSGAPDWSEIEAAINSGIGMFVTTFSGIVEIVGADPASQTAVGADSNHYNPSDVEFENGTPAKVSDHMFLLAMVALVAVAVLK